MPKKPPVHELEFIKLCGNHSELSAKLATLGCPVPDIATYAEHVSKSWFRLGQRHLQEAKKLLSANCARAAFSRSYYAAYNASKSARYRVYGKVSLKGDDHGSASSELPPDFPEVAKWSQRITKLYEHRLRADYDNWSTTNKEFTLKPAETVAEAEAFLKEVRSYLRSKFGMKL